MTDRKQSADVVIIGAGPAGAVAGALLKRKGYRVVILEKQTFPRFSIGESLLPQCMAFIEQAGMLDAVRAAGFQYKNGAAFRYQEQYSFFDFREKFTPGWGTTFQVQRGNFDKILADSAAEQGVSIHYQHEITAVDNRDDGVTVSGLDATGKPFSIAGRFLLDASGFGRVLPRLLALESPSGFPLRQSLFTHVVDHIGDEQHDRNKILITIHPQHRDVWYWLIPFGNGTCSLGVVAEPSFFERYSELKPEARLRTLVQQDPALSQLLAKAEFNQPVREIHGYAANVSSLCGPGYALLGNAGEFLDPVFSSGVTIALKSASLAAEVLDRHLSGDAVDWQQDYAKPLKQGVDVFRVFVESWYDGRFQDAIFYAGANVDIRKMISSILAGYAWDQANPFVSQAERRLNAIVEICRG